ncbi:MAG: adenylate kinase family protein [Euryarchaeota archaeon]|nr:adenylate kinase family protein [Euryarchaeota archaeon]
MKIALTGTPGTGKTAISTVLKDEFGLKVVDLNKVIRAFQYYVGWDDHRNCGVVDLEALRVHPFEDGLVLEGHISHHLPVDRVIVLRTNPAVLRGRLQEKDFSENKIRENIEAEILDVILVEALELHGNNVYEVDSTEGLRATAQLVWEITQGYALERFVVGRFDWTSYLNDS